MYRTLSNIHHSIHMLLLTTALLAAAPALADTPAAATDRADIYAIQPEGKTLPPGLLQIRLPYIYASGDTGYDADGHKTKGFKASGQGSALVLEYGVTNKLSIQFLVPYTSASKVEMDESAFRDTDTYKNLYNTTLNAFAAGVAPSLMQAGVCTSVEDCFTKLEAGLALPQDTPFPLGNGETLQVKAGTPLKNYADELVMKGVKGQVAGSGKTGIGDAQIGALYEFTDGKGPLHLALGGGFRAPTGSYANVPSNQVETGRGLWEAGVRINADYNILDAGLIAFQNQSEVPLTTGKKKVGTVRSSLDGETILVEGEKKTMKRVGVRNVGFLLGKMTFGVISPSVEWIGLKAGVGYDADSAVRVDGEETARRNLLVSEIAGISLDGVPFKLPLRADFDYSAPIKGESIGVATSKYMFTLKGYYLF